MGKENIITTIYEVEVGAWTNRHPDLVFTQALRQLIKNYRDRNKLDNHTIYTILTEEARKYNYEGLPETKGEPYDI